MTFSFDEELTADLDKVRDLLQDVDEDYMLLSDESILQEILINGSILLAAAACCRKLAARFAPMVNYSINGRSKSNSDLHAHYMAMAKGFEEKADKPSFEEVTSEVGTVTDSTTYPDRFKHGGEEEVQWP